MPVRSKPATGPQRRRGIGWVSRQQPAPASVEPTPRQGRATSPAPQAPPRRHCQGGPSQDRALYSCSCGYAFDAPVSTSVDCPHCGDRQAW